MKTLFSYSIIIKICDDFDIKRFNFKFEILLNCILARYQYFSSILSSYIKINKHTHINTHTTHTDIYIYIYIHQKKGKEYQNLSTIKHKNIYI